MDKWKGIRKEQRSAGDPADSDKIKRKQRVKGRFEVKEKEEKLFENNRCINLNCENRDEDIKIVYRLNVVSLF